MAQVKKIPQRKCVGCQEMKNKKELLRLLRTEEGTVVLDTTGRKNGRGAYLCYSKECFEKAVKSKSLERALKTPISAQTYADLKKEIDAIEGK
ncbi:MAG TPA: YlxR family protein [Candidatus Merdiplasma excrementigallinarum]|uniref:YlxR family protein n=1 Tax=Candidatus Merdiplasma excrementigallinarum TaxID=2840864 RepID=A0A9D1P0D1_9FIRM|nr:YlxR family protein [Candidatus Merdiplasma excrementigallinarum]